MDPEQGRRRAGGTGKKNGTKTGGSAQLGPRKAPVRSAAIPAIPPGVTLATLPNGLTIIVREDHYAPVVSAQAWCMTGSIHEGPWLGAGLSHVLEHMLFKGTASRPGSRIDQEVQEAGGYMNAYTSFDRTVYHIEVPNTGASTAIDILCDIMQHATLPPEELEKEMQVIAREMDMNMDDPGRRASRRLFETAYTRSPYRYTVIGYPDIFEQLKPEDIRGYYRSRYAPNNIFFVVAGDVAASEVVAQVQAAFSASKARPLPALALPNEPRQSAPREVLEEAPVELGHMHFAWHIPDLRHPDVPALDVLAVVLGNGRSSRLYRRVREAMGLVVSAEAWTYSPGSPGLFGMSATFEGAKYEGARDAMLAELRNLADEGPAPEEVEKAVKQFVSATLATRKTMQGMAQDLGSSWLAATDLNFSERYLAAIRRVRPADLQEVARRYLTEENRTLYALLPNGTRPRMSAALEQAAGMPAQLTRLPNGLRLLTKQDRRLPFVEFRTVILGGVLAETGENNGITQLTSKMLLKGTTSRTAEEIATQVESVGGSIDAYGGNNSFGINLEVLSSDVQAGLDLLADILLRPAFPDDALNRAKEVQLAALRGQRDQLLHTAAKLMRKELFGGQGYGLDSLGSAETVDRLGRGDLSSFHQRQARPDNCVLAIFGDIDPETLRANVAKAFGTWAGPEPAAPRVIASGTLPPAAQGPRRVSEQRDKKQSVIVIGFPGVTLQDPDRYPLEVLQEACSDMGSRLFLRIREKLGLAYYVGAQNFVGLAPGYFGFYAGTEPEKAALVEAELLAEADLLSAEGLTGQEVERAKAKIIGQKKIARQDLGGLAAASALDELYGLGFQHADAEEGLYTAVTVEQVKAVAAKYLRREAAVIAVVGPGPIPVA